MLGASKKIAELEQRIQDQFDKLAQYRMAMQKVALHVGVELGGRQCPDEAATVICERIDQSAQSGNKVSEPVPGSEIRPIGPGIRKIKLNGAVDVIIRQGEASKMEVFANDAAILSKVLTTVSGDLLTIDNEPMMVMSARKGNLMVVKGSFSQVAAGNIITSGGKTYSDGLVVETPCSPDFRVELTLPRVNSLCVSGAGSMAYHEVDLDELMMSVSGAGHIDVTGQANRYEAEVSGAGEIAALSLSAKHGRLRVSGAGSINATLTESVKARVSGVGKIKIAGSPKDRDTDVSGVGKIKFI
ncbi:GIN domain-containing protein [Chromobacterium vaccinii]|uniref:GIN domain-containing protein n=1 Tax=Chromobacterium vaccinii TaxID=1108595 RepID=UPI003C7238DA